MSDRCTVPPEGWWCSREPGHEGPCAARPTTTDNSADVLALALAELTDCFLEKHGCFPLDNPRWKAAMSEAYRLVGQPHTPDREQKMAALNRRTESAADGLPCDVWLPPATCIRKGVPISTLMLALTSVERPCGQHRLTRIDAHLSQPRNASGATGHE